jgi:predicted pyridoxine 5'-phosphate oxidase superfamily flavin-nucleotide-binding protein
LQQKISMAASPYQAGEPEMQEKTGEEFPVRQNARMMAPYLSAGAIRYIEAKPFVIVTSQDANGRIWTSILSGADGYLRVPDEETIELDRSLIHSSPEDSFWVNIRSQPSVGMLFIEFSTCHRYRVNGPLRVEQDKVFVSVRQVHVNCPKYILRRSLTRGKKPVYQGEAVKGRALTDELAKWIKAADTLFVGSSRTGDLDASHRGGNPGFVEVIDSGTLRVPEYEGKSLYNSLSTLLIHPKAGLLFIDLATHRTLQLSGTASVTLRDPTTGPQSEVSDRCCWIFFIEEWVLLENLKDME